MKNNLKLPIMKKTIILLNLLIAGLLFTSCSNEFKSFNDKEAFVAFDKASLTISETGGSLSVPVTLASVKGIAETISYKFIDAANTYTRTDKNGNVYDATAKQDVNFKVVGGSQTLTFGPDARTQYINIEIINQAGVYTGDLKFRIEFENTNSVNSGAEDNCVITITDEDHPLSFILGKYTVAGTDFWDGPSTWDLEVFKDSKDESKVWFSNLGNLGDSWVAENTRFYGIVSDDHKTITVPYGQESEYKYSNGKPITLLGIKIPELEEVEGTCVFTIGEDGKLLVSEEGYGFWYYIEGAGNLAIAYNLKATKK